MAKQTSDFEKFKDLSFEGFKSLAKDQSLSMYQKIGFPDSYRAGKEIKIFIDIIEKLGIKESDKDKILLDIGPGCSELPLMLLDFCNRNNYTSLLVDSEEMLNYLPDSLGIRKFTGLFPDQVPTLIDEFKGKVDYIISYSVLHSVFYNNCIFKFIDTALSLLKPGGRMLLGDIPNTSKRKRFFSTETGIKFHQHFTNTQTLPDIQHLVIEPAQIDDGIIMAILQRYRNFGFETYLLPQNDELPMSNRREDILICKI